MKNLNVPDPDVQFFLNKVTLPDPQSHKGQNGKLLLIGGSELFHAASKWSLDVAAKFVDMVFYSSVPANNDLIREAKGHFWNGIVIEREQIPNYVDEADCVLIGPGMTRSPETAHIVNALLTDYPRKKWVIDAGALQMMDVRLLTPTCVVTPHQQELLGLVDHLIENHKTTIRRAEWEAVIHRVITGNEVAAALLQ